jgi:RHS repeat-associated protein
MLINSSQAIVAKYLYDPFGNTLSLSGSLASANKYRFSSKEWNDNSGLYYYLYRFYDPNIQRWLNQDPIGERGGINLYQFVANSPINTADPLGLDGNTVILTPYVGTTQLYDRTGPWGQPGIFWPWNHATGYVQTNGPNSMTTSVTVKGMGCNTSVNPANGPMTTPNGTPVTGAGSIQATISGSPNSPFTVNLSYDVTTSGTATFTIQNYNASNLLPLLLNKGAEDPFKESVIWVPQVQVDTNGTKRLLYGISHGGDTTNLLLIAIGSDDMVAARKLLERGFDINRSGNAATLRHNTNAIELLTRAIK